MLKSIKDKLFGSPSEGMDSMERIAKARVRVHNAIESFKRASDELTNANAELAEIIEEEKIHLDDIKRTIELAEEDYRNNNELKVKLSEIID